MREGAGAPGLKPQSVNSLGFREKQRDLGLISHSEDFEVEELEEDEMMNDADPREHGSEAASDMQGGVMTRAMAHRTNGQCSAN